MRILALDSSGLVAGVAILENDTILAEYTTNFKKTHSQTLLPMLEELKKMIDLDLDTIDAIAVASGPGSFTGLRIGTATAKGLGLALEKPLIAVPTLEGIAYNLCGTEKIVCPLMDARRNQVYTGAYTFALENGTYHIQTLISQRAVDITEMIGLLNELGREVVFLGDGVPVYKKQIEERITVPYGFAPANNNCQRAASVAALGAQYYMEGKTVSADEHQPEYLRKSQAEREREEAEHAGC